MARTNIDLDEKLLRETMKFSGSKTKRQAIHAAMEQYVRAQKQRKLIQGFGADLIDPKYDYKVSRR